MDTINVLLIDDSEETIETLSLIYGSNMSFRVIGRAMQTADAMRKIEEYRPNLISIDLQLGDENGFSLTQQIHARYPDIFIVMCTVMSDTATREEARQNGVDYFVSKPMSMRELGRIRTAYVDREYRSLYRHALDSQHDLRNTDLLFSCATEGASNSNAVVERTPVTTSETYGSASGNTPTGSYGSSGNTPVFRPTEASIAVEHTARRQETDELEGRNNSGGRNSFGGRSDVVEVRTSTEKNEDAQSNTGDEEDIVANQLNEKDMVDMEDAVDVPGVVDVQQSITPETQTRMTQAELVSFLSSIAIGEDTEPLYARIQELEHENAALHSKLDAIQKLLRFEDE